MAIPLLNELCSLGQPSVIAGPVVRHVLVDQAARVDFAPGFKVKGLSGLREAVRWLRDHHFQTVVLVNRSFRSALAAKLGGIPSRIGHNTEGRGPLLTCRYNYDRNKYEAQCYLELIGQGDRVIVPKIKPPNPVSKLRNTIGIQPGARYEAKRLEFRILAEVAREMAAQGYDLGLFGGPDEQPQIEQFTLELKRFGVPSAPILSKAVLAETMEVLGGVGAMIGNDTGLMHVSAALGRPTVVAFGPNPLSKWGHPMATYQGVTGPSGLRSISPGMLIAAFNEAKKQEPA